MICLQNLQINKPIEKENERIKANSQTIFKKSGKMTSYDKYGIHFNGNLFPIYSLRYSFITLHEQSFQRQSAKSYL